MNFPPYNNHQTYHSGFGTQQVPHSPQFYPTFTDQHHHIYTMHRRATSMTDLGQITRADKNDTKPRLSKAEVDLLERQFQEQHKPSSNTKRQLADQMRVDIARINNWFQNRRAKAKQEKKQVEFGLRDAGNLSYSEPSSPELFNPSGGYFDHQLDPVENHLMSLPNANDISAPAAPFLPRYENPTAASMNSLQRTLMVAEAGYSRGFDDEFKQQQANEQFDPSIPYDGFQTADRAQFPDTNAHAMSAFQFNDGLVPAGEFVEPLLAQPLVLQESQAVQGFGCFVPMSENGHASVEASQTTFPSQLVAIHGEQDLTPRPFQSQTFAEGELKNEPRPLPIGNPYVGQESRFKSPPPSADIAARRCKPRPAALGTSALRDRTSTGPKTCNNAETVKRMHGSPAMRRVSSATGLNASASGMNVLAGRVQKSSQLPPRSPMKRNFSAGPNSFTEQNAHIIKQIPLRSRTWLTRARGPPTPRSPLLVQDGTTSDNNPQNDDKPQEDEQIVPDQYTPSSSQYESDGSYVFEGSLAGSLTTNGLISLASPPETPGHPHGPMPWNYDVPDDALLTPGFGDGFMQMPQPQYVSPLTASQPATPAFGPYGGFPFTNHSPVFDMAPSGESGVGEYFFAENIPLYPMVASTKSPVEQPKEKTYTFSNATPKDFESSS